MPTSHDTALMREQREYHLAHLQRMADALFDQLRRNHWRDAHGKPDHATMRTWLRLTHVVIRELSRLLPPPSPEAPRILLFDADAFRDFTRHTTEELNWFALMAKRDEDAVGGPGAAWRFRRRVAEERHRRAAQTQETAPTPAPGGNDGQ